MAKKLAVIVFTPCGKDIDLSEEITDLKMLSEHDHERTDAFLRKKSRHSDPKTPISRISEKPESEYISDEEDQVNQPMYLSKNKELNFLTEMKDPPKPYVKYLDLQSRDQIYSKTLKIEFKSRDKLGYQDLTIDMTKLKESNSNKRQYLKSSSGAFDCFLSSADCKFMLVIRVTNQQPALSPFTLQTDLETMDQMKKQFPVGWRSIIAKLTTFITYGPGFDSSDEEVSISFELPDEIKKLRASAAEMPKNDGQKTPELTAETDSEEENTILAQKKADIQNFLLKSSKLGYEKKVLLLTLVSEIRETLMKSLIGLDSEEDKIVLVCYAGHQFVNTQSWIKDISYGVFRTTIKWFTPREDDLTYIWMDKVLQIDDDRSYLGSMSSYSQKSVSQHIEQSIRSLKLKRFSEIFEYGTSVYITLGYQSYENNYQRYINSQLLTTILSHLNLNDISDFIRDSSLSRDLSELLSGIHKTHHHLVTKRLLSVQDNTNDIQKSQSNNDLGLRFLQYCLKQSMFTCTQNLINHCISEAKNQSQGQFHHLEAILRIFIRAAERKTAAEISTLASDTIFHDLLKDQAIQAYFREKLLSKTLKDHNDHMTEFYLVDHRISISHKTAMIRSMANNDTHYNIIDKMFASDVEPYATDAQLDGHVNRSLVLTLFADMIEIELRDVVGCEGLSLVSAYCNLESLKVKKFAETICKYIKNVPEAIDKLKSDESMSKNNLVLISLKLIAFLKENTEIDKMKIRVLKDLQIINENKKLHALKPFDFHLAQSKQIIDRVKSEHNKLTELTKRLDTIGVAIHNVKTADQDYSSLPFFNEAEISIEEIQEKFELQTIQEVYDSKSYLFVKPLLTDQVQIFKALHEYAIVRHQICQEQPKKAETCEEFIEAVTNAKKYLKNLLELCSSDGSTLKMADIVLKILPDVIQPTTQELYKEMFKKLGIRTETSNDLIKKACEMYAGRNLIQIVESSPNELSECSLIKLANLPYFDSKKTRATNVVKNFERFRTEYLALKPSPVNFTYKELTQMCCKELIESDTFQRIKTDYLSVISKLSETILFMSQEKGKETLSKLRDNLQPEYDKLAQNLSTAYTKLDFLLKDQGSNSSQVFLKCLDLCGKLEDSLDFYEISNSMVSQHSTYQYESVKAQGNFKDLIVRLMEFSVFYLELNLESLSYTVRANSINSKDYKIEDSHTAKQALDLILKQGIKFERGETAEQVNEYISRSKIAHEELSKAEDKESDSVLQIIQGLVDLSVNLKSLQESLTILYKLGIIDHTFASEAFRVMLSSSDGWIETISGESGDTKLAILVRNQGSRDKSTDKDPITVTVRKIETFATKLKYSFCNLVEKQENHKMTYFTEGKMFRLIEWLKAPKEERSQEKFTSTRLVMEDAFGNNKSTIAKLDEKAAKIKISSENDVEKIFETISSSLKIENSSVLVDNPQILADLQLNGVANIVNLSDSKKATLINPYELLLRLFSHQNKLSMAQVLYSSVQVSEIEVLAFLYRCFRDRQKRLYVVLNPGNLADMALKKLQDILRDIHADVDLNRRLIILADSKSIDLFKGNDSVNTINTKIVAEAGTKSSIDQREANPIFERYLTELSTIKVIESKRPGDGKTTWIKSQHKKETKDGYTKAIVNLSIAGEISRTHLDDLLSGMVDKVNKTSKSDIHVKIDFIDQFEEIKDMIDHVLFSLCFARKVELQSSTVDLSQKVYKIYIEVGNSIANKVFSSMNFLKMIQGFASVHPNIKETLGGFGKDKLIFDNSTSSQNLKKAASYLKAIRSSNSPGSSLLKACSKPPAANNDECKQLLESGEYFNPSCDRTFANLDFWVSVLVNQIDSMVAWLTRVASESVEEGKYARLVHIEDLAREVLQEAVTSANAVVSLHSKAANVKQKMATEIFDAYTRLEELEKHKNWTQNDNKIQEEKEKIKEKKKELGVLLKDEQNWNTESMYFSLVLKGQFLPVLGSTKALDKEGKDGKLFGVSNITKRYINYLREEFNSKYSLSSAIQKEEDHPWLAYCLAQTNFAGNQNDKKYSDVVSQSFNRIQEVTQEFENGKGFALTKQTYLKLCLMSLKAELKQPILIMGESGCGKTYLSQFLVEGLRMEKLEIVKLFSGYLEKDLIARVLGAIREAKKLKSENKKLWLFFDEFNTTPLQGMIADIMLDRCIPEYFLKSKNTADIEGIDLPDNICFIACCNPFLIRLNEQKGKKIGLVPNEKNSKLSHIVYPIPDRLLSLVWDFGQLSIEEERSHILSMIEAEKMFEGYESDQRLANFKKQLANLVHATHSFVREYEERSGVSLRDIKRVFIFYKWFHEQMPLLKQYCNKNRLKQNCNKNKETKNRIKLKKLWFLNCFEISSAICSIIICYCLKLNGQDAQKDLYDIIFDWARNSIGFVTISKVDIRNTLNSIAEIYIHEIEKKYIDRSIALNSPFKENFMTLLACYANKVPIIIVGAPGTSKTLCTNILMQVMRPEKENVLTLFSKFETCRWTVYCGSKTSTPGAINQLFNKAQNEYEKVPWDINDPKIKDSTFEFPGIFFDELGLAEISPHNPLKVLHPKLEEILGKYSFISISNWKPDQSKMNRMICLSRPDLTLDDLSDIFSGMLDVFEEKENQKISEVIRDAVDSLSRCYLLYRRWQKCTSRNMMYHSDFHGSRDIYSTFKHIMLSLKEWKRKNANKKDLERVGIEKSFSMAILNYINKAIERNMNGEVYNFGDEGYLNLPEDDLLILKELKDDDQLHETELVEKSLYEKIFTDAYKMEKYVDILDENLNAISASYAKGSSSAPAFFGLSSSEVFKLFLLNLLKKKPAFSDQISSMNSKRLQTGLDDPAVFDLILSNLRQKMHTSDCRFIAIRTEGANVDEFIVQELKEELANLANHTNSEGKKKYVAKLADLRSSSTDVTVEEILSQLKTYISEGYWVIMKNLDPIYPGLYELFNQKYINKQCFLYYGQERHSVKVHEDFKCIIILPTGSDLRRNRLIEKIQPAPFLNRFEKYFLSISNIFEGESSSKDGRNPVSSKKQTFMHTIKQTIRMAFEIYKMNSSFFLGFNIDTLVSIAVNHLNSLIEKKRYPDVAMAISIILHENVDLKFDSNAQWNDLKDSLSKYLYQMTTANFFLDKSYNQAKKGNKLNTTMKARFTSAHQNALFHNFYLGTAAPPINNFFIFTFTTQKHFLQIENQYQILSEKIQNFKKWTIIPVSALASSGQFNLKQAVTNLIQRKEEEIGGKITKVILSFQSEADYNLIRPIKNLIEDTKFEAFTALKSVLMILHVSPVGEASRQFLRKPLGISSWSGKHQSSWAIYVVDSLEPSFTYKTTLNMIDRPIKELKDIILSRDDDQFEDGGSEDSVDPEEKAESLLNDRVLRKCIFLGLNDMLPTVKTAEFSLKSLAEIFKPKQARTMNDQDVEMGEDTKSDKEIISYTVTSIIANLFSDRLKDVEVKESDGTNHQCSSGEFTELDTRLSYQLYEAYKVEIGYILQDLNSECKNLSTMVKGIIYCLNNCASESSLLDDYLSYLKVSCLKVSKPVHPTTRRMSIAREAMSNNPKVYYLPYRDYYQRLEPAFNDLRLQFDPQQSDSRFIKLNNASRLYAKLCRDLAKPGMAAGAAAGTEKDCESTRRTIVQEEGQIYRNVKEMYEMCGIREIFLKFANEPETVYAKLEAKLIYDIVATLSFKTFKDMYTEEIIEKYIEICKLLRNPNFDDNEGIEEENESEFLTNLTAAIILSRCMVEKATFFLGNLAKNSDKTMSICSKVKINGQEEKMRLNHALMHQIESVITCSNLSLPAQNLSPKEVVNFAEALEQADDFTFGSAANQIAPLLYMVSYLPEDKFREGLSKLSQVFGKSQDSALDTDLIATRSVELIKLFSIYRSKMIKTPEKIGGSRSSFEWIRTTLLDLVGYYGNFKFIGEFGIFELLEDGHVFSESEQDLLRKCLVSKAASMIRNPCKPSVFAQIKEELTANNTTIGVAAVQKFLSLVCEFSPNGKEWRSELVRMMTKEANMPDNTLDENQIVYEEAVNVFKAQKDTDSILLYCAIIVIKSYLNKDKMRDIGSSIDKDLLNSTICEPLKNTDSKMLEALLKNPDNYLFIQFVKSIYLTHHSLDPAIDRYPEIAVFVDQISDRTDETAVITFNPSLNDEIKKIAESFDSDFLKYATNNSEKKITALANFAENLVKPVLKSADVTMYLLGIHIVNTVLLKPESAERAERIQASNQKLVSIATESIQNLPIDSKMWQFWTWAINLTNHKKLLDTKLLFDQHENLTIAYVAIKTMAMMALLVVCFPDKMGYTASAWRTWDSKIANKDLRLKVAVTRETQAYCAVMEERIQTRFVSGEYIDYGPALVANLGMYSCSCGYPYVIDNCGYAVVSVKCQWCGSNVGGTGHRLNPGQRQYNQFSDLQSRIEEFNTSQSLSYTPHLKVEPGSGMYSVAKVLKLKSEKLLELKPTKKGKDQSINELRDRPQLFVDFENNLYFEHLFDHLFLAVQGLFMPKDEDRVKFDTIIKNDLNLDKADSDFVIYNRGQLRSSQDYLIKHVKNDIERIAIQVNLNPQTEVYEWLRAVVSRMGEMIILNEQKDLSTGLYIDRNIFRDPKKVISDQNKAAQERSSLTVEAKAAICMMKNDKVTLENIREAYPDLHGDKIDLYRKLDAYFVSSEFEPEKIWTIFQERAREKSSILELVIKYEALLKDLPRILSAFVEIVKYVYEEFSNKVPRSCIESTEYMQKMLNEKSRLKELHTQFSSAVSCILESYKVQYPDLFKIAADCQQDLQVEGVLRAAASENECKLNLFIIPEENDRTNENIVIKGMIMTMVNTIHNLIVKTLASDNSSIEKEPEQMDEINERIGEKKVLTTMQQFTSRLTGKVSIRDVTVTDFVGLPQDKGLKEVVIENSYPELEGRDFYIDYFKISEVYKKYLYRPEIIAESAHFQVFEFSDTLDTNRVKTRVDLLFQYADKRELRRRDNILENSNIQGNEEDAVLAKALNLINLVCYCLYQEQIVRSFNYDLLEVVKDELQDDHVKRQIAEEFKELGLPSNMKVSELHCLYYQIKTLTFKRFGRHSCLHTLDPKIETMAKSLLTKSEASQHAKAGIDQIMDILEETMFIAFSKKEIWEDDKIAIQDICPDSVEIEDPEVQELSTLVSSMKLNQAMTLYNLLK